MKANQWKDYFVFTKKERIGIITILFFLIGIWFLPKAFSPAYQTDNQKLAAFKGQITALQREDSILALNISGDSINGNANAGALFFFDPNTLPHSEWKKLGLQNKTIATILNYTGKGGRFRKPEDLSKIYGLKKADYERLLPYIRIAAINESRFEEHYSEKPKQIEQKFVKPLDINIADSNAFIALPGIGSTLANRIVNFRQKLGGFYSVSQIAEVYGVADSVFQKISSKLQCNGAAIHKININTATLDELKAHPYIKYKLANAVIQYRTQHGNYASIEALKQIQLISDSVFKKIEPYLNVH